MKKFLLLICILFTSFLCTACINNLAIQELNQMGKDYLDKGDFDNAVSRFQSSVDLDENVFESRYNLGVAYISKEDYKNAIPHLKQAVLINPSNPDAYYSLAVALESEGLAFEKNPLDDSNTDTEEETKTEVSAKEVSESLSLVEESVKMYEKYLELSPEAKDKERVQTHIQFLNDSCIRIKEEYKIDAVNTDDLKDE